MRPTETLARETDQPVEFTLIAFIAIIAATALVAALGGLVSAGDTDPWYDQLSKAPGTPPGFVFGLVWPALYALMIVGACMVWRARGGWRRAEAALGLYFLQLVPNLFWSVLFFGLHQPAAALLDILVLWILVAMMMREFRRHSVFAAALQAPYLLWLTFALYLNAWAVFAN
ncbi:MAG TPA: TspO/MBR family protein [Hyphomonadaceae bacterium]|nr:TspO/MBR family protein [Hyphomonadaceae bacterium]